MVKLITEHRAASLFLLLFIVLASIYSVVTPPLEAGDESRHYAVVKYMADTAQLPVQQPGEAQIHWSHEGNQPPLYYALAAALTFWIDTGSWNDVFWYNPHTTVGVPLRPDNKNMTIHPPGAGWPWRGHVLAVHLIRFFSICLAAVTLVAGYRLALHLFRGRRWLAAGAMAVTAFNPMFLFISAAVNNDNLVITLVSLAVLLMVSMAEWPAREMDGLPGRQMEEQTAARSAISPSPHPRTTPPNLSSVALLGLLIGLGALSKLYALGLLPLAGLLLVWLAYYVSRQRPLPSSPQPDEVSFPPAGRRLPEAVSTTINISRFIRLSLTWNLVLILVVFLVAGWFYGRNALLYNGDTLALQVMRDTAGQRAESPSLATLQAEFEGFRIAYWALFGGVNILVHSWIYRLLDVVSLIAAVGVAAFIGAVGLTALSPASTAPSPVMLHDARPHRAAGVSLQATLAVFSLPAFAVLFGWYLIMVAGVIIWTLTQPAGQGRLLYPAITAISALGLLGLTWWLPRRDQYVVVVLVELGLLLFAALAPWLYIAPVYARPPVLAGADLPPDLQPVNLVYDGKIRLIGYQMPEPTVRPAETLDLTVYWQLLEPVELDYSVFVHLLGRQRHKAGQLDTYPGAGRWPTTLLSPGDIVADHYEVPIHPDTEQTQAPTQLLIAVGLYDYHEPGRPGRPAVNSAGQTVEPIIARARLIPWQWPDPPRLAQPVYFIGPTGQPIITLLSYELAGDFSSLTLNWQANTAIETDYTVFIQAWSPAALAQIGLSTYTAGFDGPPRQGDYPTSLWRPGDIVVDTHPLDLTHLPDGQYILIAGLYNPATGERLPATSGGDPLPDYAVRAGTLDIGE